MKKQNAENALAAQDLFETMPVPRAYFTLAIPAVLAKIVMLVYNLADTWFVSSTGNTQLVAGVSLGAPILLLMVALGDVFGQGGASVITRLMGKREYSAVRSLSAFNFWCALLCGGILTVVLLVFQTPILYLIGADADTLPYAAQYYRWIVLAAPIVAINIVPVNILRTEGLAKESMKGNILGSVVNLILDPILILALGMGACGAAIASVIGYLCAAVYYMYAYARHSKMLSIDLRAARVDRRSLSDILGIGIPCSLSNVMQSVGIAMANRFLLVYGSDKIAAFGIASKINMVVMMVLVGFSFGALPLVGYNYGAKNHPRLRQVLKFMYSFELLLAAGMAVVLAAFAPRLIALFLTDAQVVLAGALMLRSMMLGAVFCGFILVTTCVFQALGQAKGALLMNVNRQGILYFVLLTVLSVTVGYYGVVFAQAICDILCAAMGGALLMHILKKLR